MIGLSASMSPQKPSLAPAFGSFISAQPEVDGTLPATHISDGFGFRAILDCGELRPEPCPVFDNEPLLYLFYGRPSYRVNSQVLASAIDAYAPVCFVLRPSSVDRPRRVFPFDSGAFHAERFSEAMHRKMMRDDFALEPGPSSPRQLISLFFGTNERYMRNEPLEAVTAPGLAFEVSSYHTLISSRHENVFDERISAVEIQIDEPLPLAGNVEAVVMPDRFAIPEVLASLDAAGAVPLLYDYVARLRPEAFTGNIYQLVRDYYRSRGYL
jgi:hypothetical protein